MKKLLGIVVLGLLWCSISFAETKSPEPPYEYSTHWNTRIITPDDPTTFQRIKYIGEEKRFMIDPNRTPSNLRKNRKLDQFRARPYVYHAFYENGLAIELLIYFNFEKNKNITTADVLALEYAKALGRMPLILLQDVHALHVLADTKGRANINKGEIIMYGNNPKTINGKLYGFDTHTEEILFHEIIHVSLEWTLWYNPEFNSPLNKRILKKSKKLKKIKKINWVDWREAQKKDKGYITQYGKKNRNREDFTESFLMWFAARYNRVPEPNIEEILKLIPNRIQFFDDQSFDMYPLYKRIKVKRKKIKEERTANPLILNPNTLAIFCKAQGDCWDTMLEDYQQYLKDPSYKAWVTTRNIISKEFNGNVWGWRTGGDSMVEAWVGANETCEKFKDSDDECVVVFRGNEFVDERIKKMFIDVNHGN